MIGFLLKILLVAGLVVGTAGLVFHKKGSLPDLSALPQTIGRSLSSVSLNSAGDIGRRLSSSLDSLVTHPGRNSPVVLGVKITNDSLNALIEVIQKLPPDQVEQVKDLICKPTNQ